MSEEPQECPLCMEILELDDLSFFPCTCGYQICRFCWHRIRTNESGSCPACRKSYSEDPAHFKPITSDEMNQIKRERKLKETHERQKTMENRKHFANLRVIQKNLMFVVGLPLSLTDPEVLKRQEYFGKFGKILKVTLTKMTSNSSCTTNSSNNVVHPYQSAYTMFARVEDALRAIRSINKMQSHGKPLKASLGTTKYCSRFLKGIQCLKQDCMYLHEAVEDEASFTKDEIQQGKHTSYEQKLYNIYCCTDDTSTSTTNTTSTTNPTNTNAANTSHTNKSNNNQATNGSLKVCNNSVDAGNLNVSCPASELLLNGTKTTKLLQPANQKKCCWNISGSTIVQSNNRSISTSAANERSSNDGHMTQKNSAATNVSEKISRSKRKGTQQGKNIKSSVSETFQKSSLSDNPDDDAGNSNISNTLKENGAVSKSADDVSDQVPREKDDLRQDSTNLSRHVLCEDEAISEGNQTVSSLQLSEGSTQDCSSSDLDEVDVAGGDFETSQDEGSRLTLYIETTGSILDDFLEGDIKTLNGEDCLPRNASTPEKNGNAPFISPLDISKIELDPANGFSRNFNERDKSHPDDDLGFDPWLESNQGLVDLVKSEESLVQNRSKYVVDAFYPLTSHNCFEDDSFPLHGLFNNSGSSGINGRMPEHVPSVYHGNASFGFHKELEQPQHQQLQEQNIQQHMRQPDMCHSVPQGYQMSDPTPFPVNNYCNIQIQQQQQQLNQYHYQRLANQRQPAPPIPHNLMSQLQLNQLQLLQLDIQHRQKQLQWMEQQIRQQSLQERQQRLNEDERKWQNGLKAMLPNVNISFGPRPPFIKGLECPSNFLNMSNNDVSSRHYRNEEFKNGLVHEVASLDPAIINTGAVAKYSNELKPTNSSFNESFNKFDFPANHHSGAQSGFPYSLPYSNNDLPQNNLPTTSHLSNWTAANHFGSSHVGGSMAPPISLLPKRGAAIPPPPGFEKVRPQRNNLFQS